MSDVTLVITSCGRHDLLKRTLESFVLANTYPIAKTIIVEDAGLEAPNWLTFSSLGEIVWIKNKRQRGQIWSIDRAYSEVTTPYIFHCEDDWQFDRTLAGNFIAESRDILEADKKALQVWIRSDAGHPVHSDDSYELPYMDQDWNEGWMGFSFNPGLRRLSDWQRIGSYGKHVGYNPQYCGELELNHLYGSLDYICPFLRGIVTHIGGQAHVDWAKAPRAPKVLIAIPACHKYDYTNKGDGRIHKNRETNEKLEAVRNTWAKDVEAFDDYVTFKFFFGKGGDRQPGPDEVFLDCPDNYEGLPHKVKAIYQWALAHGFDYVFKGDDDTYIYVDRLLATDFQDQQYVGYCSDEPTQPTATIYASGGSGYWLDKKCMEIIINSQPNDWAEDRWVGGVLYARGIKAKRDARYLPGFWEHFVDLSKLPDNHSYITMHACTPAMMEELHSKTVNANFTYVKRALHEPARDNSIYQDLIEELTIMAEDIGNGLANDQAKALNVKLDKLFKIVSNLAQGLDRIETRLETFNKKSGQKI